MSEFKVIPIARDSNVKPLRCKDFDDECPDVQDKTVCWLHAPEEGYCPYLQTEE